MVYLQVGPYSARFNSRAACMNWLAHQGILPSDSILHNQRLWYKTKTEITGIPIEINIVEFLTDDNDLIEKYLNSL
jgi:hypothetical protein